MKPFQAVITGLFLAAALAAPALANVFALDGQDPRAPAPRTGPDRSLAAVGVIVTGAPVPASDDGRMIRTRGSAFLVSPCYILTNYHAVFGLAYDGPEQGREYAAEFLVGADPAFAFRWVVNATPVRWGEFNRRKEHDWALLKLDACVGGQADIGWLDLAPEPGPDMLGAAVSLAGYPADKSERTLWVEPNCHIEAMQADTEKVLHGCSVRSGASGGPLLVQRPSGPAAVAIQCGELNATDSLIGRWDPHYANTAVTVAEVLQDPEVRRLLDADIAAFREARPEPLPPPQVALAAPPAPGQPAADQTAAPAPHPAVESQTTGFAGLL